MASAPDTEGIYAAYLSSDVGYGIVLLAFKEGLLAGADAFGVVIKGRYNLSDNGVSINAEVNVPAGVPLLQRGVSFDAGTQYPINAVLPLDFVNQDYLSLETIHGPLNIRLKKLVNFG